MAESLGSVLLRRIKRTGPMTVAEYMAEALHHQSGGYYADGDPFGAAGDFITAPEISQMFGELLGLWTLSAWIANGAPEPACLVELGPGRGTLMADMVRSIGGVVDVSEVFQIHMVETNPSLRRIQADTLAPLKPVWHNDVSSLPEQPWFLVANEFLDALPMHQLRWTEGAWRECLVVPDAAGTGLAWGVERSESPLAALLPAQTRQSPIDGAMAELSLAANAIVTGIAHHVVRHGGAALIIDYGSERFGAGDSLQAVRHHQPVEVLRDPGLADLSSHVDFSQIREACRAAGADFAGPVEQGRFLIDLGIEERAGALSRGATLGQRRDIESALRRLIGSAEMGTLFKVAGLLPPGTPDLAGFG